jgi:hypothetical protein
MDPLQLLFGSNGVGDAVERIAGHTVHAPNAGFRENIHQQLRHVVLGHDVNRTGIVGGPIR